MRREKNIREVHERRQRLKALREESKAMRPIDLFKKVVRAITDKAGVRKPRPPQGEARPVLWFVQDFPGVKHEPMRVRARHTRVEGRTKSEARAALKARLGVTRLPAGTVLVRV